MVKPLPPATPRRGKRKRSHPPRPLASRAAIGLDAPNSNAANRKRTGGPANLCRQGPSLRRLSMANRHNPAAGTGIKSPPGRKTPEERKFDAMNIAPVPFSAPRTCPVFCPPFSALSAIRPRGGIAIPVCPRCQTKYVPSQFAPGTQFE